ncbi:hypothetical protein FBQ82_00105 [Anaerolineae bacterium CFX7]|nr:hypothetical protein [Anaerolineae bacterium CFX7]
MGRTWDPKGKRPIVQRVEKERRGVSTVVGFTMTEKLYRRHFPKSMKSKQVIEALKHIHGYLLAGFASIWDGASIHTSAKTQGYLDEHPEIVVEPLPPYPPELNPEEYCHGNVKQRLKNATPDNVGGVMRHLDRRIAHCASV